MELGTRPGWRRRIGALAWLAGWAVLLWLVVRPWGDLGGLVTERLRWLERVALWGGLALGHTLGELARAGDAPAGRRARRTRWVLYPAALTAALGLLGLRLAAADDAIGVALTAWLAYTAGASSALLGIGVVPAAGFPQDRDRDGGGSSAA